MAGPLAEATADLRLSDGKFSADLSTIMSRLRTAVAQMEAQGKVDLQATVKVDDTAARATVQAFRDETTALGQINVQLDARTEQIKQARQELENLRTLAASISDTRVTVDAVLRDQEAVASATRLQEILTALGSQSPVISPTLNATEAITSVELLNAELDKLDAKRVDVKVSSDGIAKTGAELAALDTAATRTASDSGGFGRLATRLGLIGGVGVAAVGALGTAITVLGVNSAASIESTVKSFENILGDATKAHDLFSQLQQFSIPAPFDTIVLANTAKQLLAIGDNVNQVVPDVKVLAGAVALLGNQDPAAFERLTLALGQIGSSVHVNLQDIRQISQALPGFNAQQQLAAGAAAQLGITTQEAAAKIADGSIQGAAAMRILIEQMANFPGAATAIASAADTLKGKLSAFKDIVKLDLIGSFAGLTGQLKDALLPLGDSLDVAFKAIGPQLSSALSNLLPAVGPFVEQLGTALAPAFGGIFTGLGGVLQGLTPVLASVLPVVGELAKTFGDLAAAVGPALGSSVKILSDTVVPVIQSVSSVLEAIPTGALTTLLTGFLAFKALSGIRSIFDNLAFGLQKASLEAEGATASLKKLEEGGAATGRFSQAAGRATSLVVGAFSGMALASEDASTRIFGAVGAIGTTLSQLASGNFVGAGLTAIGTAVGAIVGHFQEGQRKADEFKRHVDDLATSIRTALNLTTADLPTLDVSKIVAADDFQKEIEKAFGPDLRAKIKAQLQTSLTAQDVTNALKQGGGGLGAILSDALGTSITVDPQLIADIVTKFPDHASPELTHRVAAAAGFSVEDLRRVAGEGAQGVRETLERVLGVPVHVDPALLADIVKAFDSLAKTGKATTTQVAADLQFVADKPIDTAKLIANIGSLNDALGGLGGPFGAAVDKITATLPSAFDAMSPQVQTLVRNLDAATIAAETFGNVKFDPLDAALAQVKEAADEVKTTFSDLTSALSQSIANQNLQAQLNGLSSSLDAVIGQSAFDSAKAKSESIKTQLDDQQSRIADLKAQLADEQAKALQAAADLDVRIADAQAHGSVTGLAALEAQRALVNAGSDKTLREIDKANRTVAGLQDQLAGLDLTTPQKLIDIVKGQAKAAGTDLWTFLLQGPTTEARQVYQQDLAAVVNSAFSQIQKVDDTQGPQAALDLVSSIQGGLRDQLLKGGFAPGTVDEIVQNMLNPDKLKASLTDELNANLDAATAVAGKAGHAVDIGVTTSSIETALAELAKTLAGQPPIPVNISLVPSGPSASAQQQALAGLVGAIPPDLTVSPALDFNVIDKQIAAFHPTATVGLAPDFNVIDRQIADHQAALTTVVAPDFNVIDREIADHRSTLAASVAPDFAVADKQLAVHDSTLPATVRPDTTLLDQILLRPRTVTATVVADFTQLDKQLFLRNLATLGALTLGAADGGIFEFFRQGGFSQHPLRDAAHVAQIAPAGAWRVWAEPETGGEGYVPLALAKRDRSTEIVRTIADMFGYRLEPKIDVNPTIDIFPAVSPVVNLHPSFTVPALPDRAGRDTSIVQTFARTLASFGQPPTSLSGDGRMFLTLPHALREVVQRNLDWAGGNASFGPETLIGSVVSGLVRPFVQSLMADSPPPSRPTVVSVAHMTGWTTASPSPSTLRLVTVDPKVPAWPVASSVAVSPLSVPSIFEHDKRSAFPSPFGSQLVVPWPVLREALSPGATGGPATISHLPGWSSFMIDPVRASVSSLFDGKTVVAPFAIPGAPGGFTSIVDRTGPTSIFHPASPAQAVGALQFHSVSPPVTVMPSQVTALFGTQVPYVAPLLPPNMQVQVTPHADLAAAIRELTQMLRSGSPHSERLARAESIARHIHVEAGAITLTSDRPRQSARELVDELTRMAY